MQEAINNFWSWLPNLVGALVILLIGWIVARLIAAAVRRVLSGMGADRVVEEGSVGRYKQGVAPRLTVSNLVATVAFWFVLGIAILLALSALQIPELGAAIGGVVAYLPNVIAAILILVVGVALAAGIGAVTQRLAGGTMIGRVVQTALPAVIVAIAISMALVQLQIAPMIVLATYVIVLGSLGLGLALAFGLGARSVAGRIVEQGYQEARERAPQAREEMEETRARAREEGEHMRDEADRRVDERRARSQEEGAVRTSRDERERDYERPMSRPVERTGAEQRQASQGPGYTEGTERTGGGSSTEPLTRPETGGTSEQPGQRREWPEDPGRDKETGTDETRRIA
jgi:uncharacterized membrane protein YfbV (UPF0208 family)